MAIRIPSIYIRELNLQNGTLIDVAAENGALTIVPHKETIKDKVEAKFALFETTGKVIGNDYDWGNDIQGDEIW